MFSYELAKKLRDAGFKQEGRGELISERGAYYDFYPEKNVYCPTFSELIEACGDKFEYLNRVHGGGWVAGTKDTPLEGTLDTSNYESGKTPEEAVANLWLELNKK